jgi:hypothetical protein
VAVVSCLLIIHCRNVHSFHHPPRLRPFRVGSTTRNHRRDFDASLSRLHSTRTSPTMPPKATASSSKGQQSLFAFFKPPTSSSSNAPAPAPSSSASKPKPKPVSTPAAAPKAVSTPKASTSKPAVASSSATKATNGEAVASSSTPAQARRVDSTPLTTSDKPEASSSQSVSTCVRTEEGTRADVGDSRCRRRGTLPLTRTRTRLPSRGSDPLGTSLSSSTRTRTTAMVSLRISLERSILMSLYSQAEDQAEGQVQVQGR